jgi:hypothetical protein
MYLFTRLSRDESKPFVKQYKILRPQKNETFDVYFNRRNNFYTLTPLAAPSLLSSFVPYSCSCTRYFKYAFCKHAIGLGIVRGNFQVPAEHSLALLGEQGKRGRKKGSKNVCYEKPQNKHQT